MKKKKAVIVFEDDGKKTSAEINSDLDTVQLVGLLEQLKHTILTKEITKSKSKL